MSEVELARLDGIAAAWGLSRAATLRRLVATADVQGAPKGVAAPERRQGPGAADTTPMRRAPGGNWRNRRAGAGRPPGVCPAGRLAQSRHVGGGPDGPQSGPLGSARRLHLGVRIETSEHLTQPGTRWRVGRARWSGHRPAPPGRRASISEHTGKRNSASGAGPDSHPHAPDRALPLACAQPGLPGRSHHSAPAASATLQDHIGRRLRPELDSSPMQRAASGGLQRLGGSGEAPLVVLVSVAAAARGVPSPSGRAAIRRPFETINGSGLAIVPGSLAGTQLALGHQEVLHEAVPDGRVDVPPGRRVVTGARPVIPPLRHRCSVITSAPAIKSCAGAVVPRGLEGVAAGRANGERTAAVPRGGTRRSCGAPEPCTRQRLVTLGGTLALLYSEWHGGPRCPMRTAIAAGQGAVCVPGAYMRCVRAARIAASALRRGASSSSSTTWP